MDEKLIAREPSPDRLAVGSIMASPSPPTRLWTILCIACPRGSTEPAYGGEPAGLAVQGSAHEPFRWPPSAGA